MWQMKELIHTYTTPPTSLCVALQAGNFSVLHLGLSYFHNYPFQVLLKLVSNQCSLVRQSLHGENKGTLGLSAGGDDPPVFGKQLRNTYTTCSACVLLPPCTWANCEVELQWCAHKGARFTPQNNIMGGKVLSLECWCPPSIEGYLVAG